MTKYIKTNEKIEVTNYPYGFKLRTNLFDYIEFSPKKGYRHCTQTIDPRNGRLNNPKKSTYYPLLVRFYDENNHIKSIGFDFNGDKEINRGCEFLAANFELFTTDEIKYLYSFILSMSIVDFKATCIYGGSKAEDLKPFYTEFWTILKEGLKDGSNLFASLKLDTEAIDATKPANYSPFTVTHYSSTPQTL